MQTKGTAKMEGYFWVGIGAVVCILAWRAHLGSFGEPGPGFLAFASGLFVAIVGLIMAISQRFSETAPGYRPQVKHTFQNISWSRMGYTMGLLLFYALFLNTLGYILTTVLVMWGLFYGRETNRWVSSIWISLITVASSYLVFEVWLRCQLPRGFFPWW
jgi:hypothetical protein